MLESKGAIMKMKQSYQNLCTEFYDLTKPEAGPKEVAFYEAILRKARGPILEAMCGSGRLLIPLLKRGLVIDGMDNSSYMLESCSRRCKEIGFHVELYNQSLQTFILQKKYSLIFIAFGSFQLIREREDALSILKNLRQHLLPGGQLILETFIPWDELKNNIEGSVLSGQSKLISSELTTHSSSGYKLINKSAVTTYFQEQIKISHTTYEKWENGKLVLTEEEEYFLRWYHRYEMQLFLEKSGFHSIQILDESFEDNEQALVYVASCGE